MNLSPLAVDNNSVSKTMDQQGTPAQQIFFRRLHMMITEETHSGRIVWLPDGLGFAIPSKQAFTDTILPRYFGQSQFASFIRRLKRWGFVRQGGGFYHDQFRRDMVFEDDDDDEGYDFHIKRLHPPPIVHINNSSKSKGPLKKRLKQRFEQRVPSPPPICLSPSSDGGIFLPSNKSSDLHIMPELMRVINRNKRKERNELPLLPTKTTELSKNPEEIMVARTLASLELQVRKKPSFVGCVECSQPSVPIPYLVKPKTFSLGRAA